MQKETDPVRSPIRSRVQTGSAFFICPREGSGNSRQEEIKAKNKEELFQLLFISKNLSKNQFFGGHKGPPHAGNAKQATILNVRNLHMCLIPLHLSIPLGD